MKIGILTFHCAHNYGAVLQAYASQKFLISYGHDVRVIDYRPDYLISSYKIYNRNASLCKWILQFPFLPKRYLRYRRFDKFITEKLDGSKNLAGLATF